MSRQRTVNDQRFWRNPLLQSCTTEDKVALLHLLTSPDSNIIGAYPLVPRIAGAEIGWTQDQWLQVMERLRLSDLAWYDIERMFVWVRIWWEHHLASQSMGPKLRNRTIDDIRRLPEPWRELFLHDFRQRLNNEHLTILDAALKCNLSSDTVSIPYPYGIDTTSNFSRRNTNANSNSKLTLTPTTTPPPPVDNSGIPEAHRAEIEDAITRSQLAGLAKADPQAVLDALAKQFKSATHPPRSPAAMAYFLSQHLKGPTETPSKARASPEELAKLMGRCFVWPHDNPSHYVKIGDQGEFEQFALEEGRFVRRVGRLNKGGLLTAIQENRLREVSSTIIDELVKGVSA